MRRHCDAEVDNNDEIDAWAHGTDTGSASVIQTIRSEGTVDRSALCRPIRSTTETGKARFEIRGGHVPRLPDRAELPTGCPSRVMMKSCPASSASITRSQLFRSSA